MIQRREFPHAPHRSLHVRQNLSGHPGPAIRHLAEATFMHSSGSWKLMLFASQDVKLAISTFCRLLGREVEIDPALERL